MMFPSFVLPLTVAVGLAILVTATHRRLPPVVAARAVTITLAVVAAAAVPTLWIVSLGYVAHLPMLDDAWTASVMRRPPKIHVEIQILNRTPSNFGSFPSIACADNAASKWIQPHRLLASASRCIRGVTRSRRHYPLRFLFPVPGDQSRYIDTAESRDSLNATKENA